MILREELEELAQRRGVEVHYVLGDHRGPGAAELLSAEHLERLVPDIAARDVYVCGPPAMADGDGREPAPRRRPAAPGDHGAVRVLMRRALAALVVTVVVVVLLVSLRHAPADARGTRSRRCARRRRSARRRRRRGTHPPGSITGKGPLLTTPFSSIQVQATLHRRQADRRPDAVADRQRHAHAGAQRARRADPARGGARGGQRGHRRRHGRDLHERELARLAGRRRSRRRALTERRVEHVMGMPVRVDVRDRGVGAAALDARLRVAALRRRDASAPTGADREICRLDRGELVAARRASRRCARCSRAASGCASRPAATSTRARAGRSTRRGLVKGWAVDRAARAAGGGGGAALLHRRGRRRARCAAGRGGSACAPAAARPRSPRCSS